MEHIAPGVDRDFGTDTRPCYLQRLPVSELKADRFLFSQSRPVEALRDRKSIVDSHMRSGERRCRGVDDETMDRLISYGCDDARALLQPALPPRSGEWLDTLPRLSRKAHVAYLPVLAAREGTYNPQPAAPGRNW